MTPQYIFTVEVGTSRTKTSLWTVTAQFAVHASSTCDLQRTEPLWAEIDGERAPL